MKQYGALQNGSDIRGIAEDTVPGERVNLDEEAVQALATAFLSWLCRTTRKKPSQLVLSAGRDSRRSGDRLLGTLLQALAPYGCKLFDAGLSSTPAMFHSTLYPAWDCDGAIMLTASHMPANRNGMKFFTKEGGLDKADIEEIINIASSPSPLTGMEKAAYPAEVLPIDLIGAYSRELRAMIQEGLRAGEPGECADKPLSGLKIAVDAGNGAGGFYALQVLEPLGADIGSSRYLEPDGSFPHHIPNPENKEAMESIRAAVRESGSDLGLIFDTDVDRVAAIDEKGKAISQNGIVALAAVLIAHDHPGTTVVTDSVTSPALTAFLEGLGLKHLRYKRGYRNVIGKAQELNRKGVDAELAIETSGHAAYRSNHFLDDGAYLATKIVIRAALLKKERKGISSLIADLKEATEKAEFRLPIEGEHFSETGDAILHAIEQGVLEGQGLSGVEVEAPNYEGVRLRFTAEDIRGWMLIRKSLHEPLMPVNMEAECRGGCRKIAAVLASWLEDFPQADAGRLYAFMEGKE